MLRFITGRAGSGKTEQCLREIGASLKKEPLGNPLILLVPEQATFQMEYLLTTSGIPGMIRAQVFSFRRLAWRVLLEIGGASKVPIGELGKRMILRRLLETNKDSLRVFAHSAGKAGFADAVARSLGEMKIYQVTPDDLEYVSEHIINSCGRLQDKLRDISLIYRQFDSFLAGRYTDPDDYLTILAQGLDKSSSLKGAEVWVDGFTGFTPQEFSVLESLMKHTKKVNVSLCLDPQCLEEELTENHLFYPTWETFQEIKRRAQRAGIAVEAPLVMPAEKLVRFRVGSLAHLEKNLNLYPVEAAMECTGLQVIPAANRRAEVEAVCREIIGLCREKNYRWRDIAILVRDIDTYQELFAAVFGDYDIPFFMDCKRQMLHHPLVELIRSALETIVRDWAYEPLFRCIKTDLLSIEREEADLLENYVLAYGIRGKARWQSQTWTFHRRFTLGEDNQGQPEKDDGQELINHLRERVVEIFADLHTTVSQADSVKEITVALYTFLEEAGVQKTLRDWAYQSEQRGHPGLAREHLQVWQGISGLFNEIVEAMGDEKLTPESYLQVLETGLENLRLGLIPPGLDQVVIGTLDRSRNSNVRALFLLGVNEGVLPARLADDGILNDGDRMILAEAGLVIAPGARRKAFDEQYMIYCALTRSRDFLWVSYPLADEEGRGLTESSVVRRLKEIFPELRENCCHVEPDNQVLAENSVVDYIAHPGPVLNYLGRRLRQFRTGREIEPLWWDVYNWFNSDPERQKALKRVIQGVFYTNQAVTLSPKTRQRFFNQTIITSVSRLERYRACPYSYFAAYGLKLKEREIYRLAAPDMGEFFHAALKVFNDKLQQQGLDWGQLDNSLCDKLADGIVDELAPQLQNEILLSTARYRYLTGKLRRTVKRAATILTEHARRGSFRPIGVEVAFGGDGVLPAVVADLGGGHRLELRGRIDRIDAATLSDRTYVRVIDYKSSDNSLALAEVYHGLRLQLVTYLHAVLTGGRLLEGPILPAGIMYFTVKEPILTNSGPLTAEEAAREMLKRLKMKGLLLAEPDLIRLMDNRLTSGYSDILAVGMNQEGGFYANARVASLEQFEALRCHLMKVLVETGKEIIGGLIPIAPFKYKDSSACSYCQFRPICRFDITMAENRYRMLEGLSDEGIWSQLLGEEGK